MVQARTNERGRDLSVPCGTVRGTPSAWDPEIVFEPGLDTRRDFEYRWRRFCLVNEMVCEHSFLASNRT